MYVTFGEGKNHAAQLKRGLENLGSKFVARICWWCNGETMRKCQHCDVCGKGRFYGSSLGLLIGNEPAPESVVNQVLIAAVRTSPPTEGGGR